jgi:hypothetical protein
LPGPAKVQQAQTMRSTPLALNDWRHVDAATDWLALVDWESANEEIEQITPEFRAHPDVLAVRWRIFAMGGQPLHPHRHPRDLSPSRGQDTGPQTCW